ncbi:gastrula zinc finger protein XlCGF7.1-like [Cryptotermes secundus]|uniref:gastrula zinc finger protein XlCGF7.1-like n=1 Tax=Cryptotermes secundus TaxID=105785 RepID=UPI000CD7C673|nr:gastrula zinc finger protein XlCGF7.1-like [Cryptotermes secundus]
MASEEVRLSRLRRTLHSLATRVPKIILTRVDWTFPALKNQASVKLSATAHLKGVNAEERLCEQSAGLQELYGGEDLHTCEICKKSFSRKYNLSGHASGSSRETMSRCEMCITSLTPKRSETQRFGAAIRPFTCNVCKRSFTGRAKLENHIRVHTGERPFSCELCKQRFTQLHNLYRHRKVHNGERPFSCEVCKKAFAEKYTLQKHLRMHSGERPFSCKVCKKTFANISNLNIHLRIHSVQRPFSCKV